MAKERRTAEELEKLVFAEASQHRECEGATGVTVRPIADPRVDFNWEVSFAHNATGMCQDIIVSIATRLQGRYELREPQATASTIYRDYFIDIEHDAQHWRVRGIKHSRTDQSLLPPAFNYPDQRTAEQYAKAAIDHQLSSHRR
jgi:hypothetical protein